MKKRYKSCKNCKDKFEVNPARPLFPTCSYECAIQFCDKAKVKELNEKVKKMKPFAHFNKNKKYLQDEINKLARMIDEKCDFTTCIDCGKPFGKQVDACHYHGRGSNSTLRYNLHNLHSGKSDCNKYSDKHKVGYETGLQVRYGIEYYDYVVNELPLIYKSIHLNETEVIEKLKIVRKINRTFHTYQLGSSLQARKLFNDIIGIYK